MNFKEWATQTVTIVLCDTFDNERNITIPIKIVEKYLDDVMNITNAIDNYKDIAMELRTYIKNNYIQNKYYSLSGIRIYSNPKSDRIVKIKLNSND